MGAIVPTVDAGWIVDEEVAPGPYPRDAQFAFGRAPGLAAAADIINPAWRPRRTNDES